MAGGDAGRGKDAPAELVQSCRTSPHPCVLLLGCGRCSRPEVSADEAQCSGDWANGVHLPGNSWNNKLYHPKQQNHKRGSACSPPHQSPSSGAPRPPVSNWRKLSVTKRSSTASTELPHKAHSELCSAGIGPQGAQRAEQAMPDPSHPADCTAPSSSRCRPPDNHPQHGLTGISLTFGTNGAVPPTALQMPDRGRRLLAAPRPHKGTGGQGGKAAVADGLPGKTAKSGCRRGKKTPFLCCGTGQRLRCSPCAPGVGGTREAPTPSVHCREFGSARQRSGCIPAVSTADLLCFKNNDKNVSNEINS